MLVLSGWRSPWWQAGGLARRLSRLTSGRRSDFHAISYALTHTIEAAARRVIDIAWALPLSPLNSTTEVDVVGVSMGGLVARAASAGIGAPAEHPEHRLHIRTLFTLATPHRGARLARWIRPDAAARCMAPGSQWLERLDRLSRDERYVIIPYARTGDAWVGAGRTAPPGCDPIWTRGPAFLSHFTIARDELIALDIARRLRGEPPLAGAASPPPRD